MITADMHITDMINEVQKVSGSSYNFMDMANDGTDEVAKLVDLLYSKKCIDKNKRERATS